MNENHEVRRRGSVCRLAGFLRLSAAMLLGLSPIATAQGVRCIAKATGNWSDPAVWHTGTVPTSADEAWIDGGSDVTVDIFGATCSSLLVINGSLRISSSTALLSVPGSVSLDGGGVSSALTMSNGKLLLAGPFTIGTGSVTLTGGEIEFTNGSQDIPSGSYFDLRLMGGTKTALGPLTVNGNMTIVSGAEFVAGPYTHRIKGDWVNQGGFTSGAGTVILNGTSPQNITGATSFTNLTLSAAGKKTALADITVKNALTINALATFDPGGFLLTVKGNWTNDGTFRHDTGTVDIGGTGTSLLSGDASFNNLIFSGSGAKTTSVGLTVNGTFTNNAGSSFDAGSYTHTFKGRWENAGIFIGGTSTAVMEGTTQQILTGQSRFNDLTIRNPEGIRFVDTMPDTILGVLRFASGNIFLGPNELVLGLNASIIGAGKGQSIVTDGLGVVRKRIEGGTGAGTFTFPVAATASSYNPCTIALRPTAPEPPEIFRVRVWPLDMLAPGFATLDTNKFAWREWVISEQTPGENHANLSFQWDRPDQGTQSWASTTSPLAASLYRYDSATAAYLVFDDAAGLPPFAGPLTVSTSAFLAPEFGPIIVGPRAPLATQLVSFEGTALGSRRVQLSWTTVSEVNNYGFFVQRKAAADTAWRAVPGGFLPGQGTTNEAHTYGFLDTSVSEGAWDYRLRQQDLDGSAHYSKTVVITTLTSVAPIAVPEHYALFQNYPNPFNPSTAIRYSLPGDAEVTLEVFNLLGQRVALLVRERQRAGYHQVTFHAAGLASGAYIYAIRAGEYHASKRLVVLR